MTQILFGFHAVATRIKAYPKSVKEVLVDRSRRDKRMQQFLERAEAAKVRVVEADGKRLAGMTGNDRHQGVVAVVEQIQLAKSLDDLLDTITGAPLLLVLDNVTDPHNLGACLRAADGAGAHAVIAPKDHACGLNATVAKVASGADRKSVV